MGRRLNSVPGLSSNHECVVGGALQYQQQAMPQTQAVCPTVQLNSDVVYQR